MAVVELSNRKESEMQTTSIPLLLGEIAGFRRLTVKEYHRLIEIDLLTPSDRVELIEGFLVKKMSHNPPHADLLRWLTMKLSVMLPKGWVLSVQLPITLADSEPEPDFAVIRSRGRYYRDHGHPEPSDSPLVIEIADTSLAGDRRDKGRMYARAIIPTYWIVNVNEQQIEVYSSPSGPNDEPSFGQRRDFRLGESVPVVLDGVEVGTVAVAELFD